MIEIEEYRTVPDYIEEDFNSILYVDDEESNLRVFDSVFSRYYNIYTANNGRTAIEMLNEFEIHMIITDQKMPEMTGTDLLEKTLEDFPDIIRIILTGFADIQAIIKAINKCSIYKYITKPYENAEIREIIDKGLEIYNMRQEKYRKEQIAEQGDNGSEQNNEKALPAFSGTTKVIPLVSDLMLKADEFENYFDFHINYRLKQEGTFSNVYGDFVLNADDEGSSMFFVTMKVDPDEQGALSYMYLKSKLRTTLESTGNSVDLAELKEHLLSNFVAHDMKEPEDMKILTYHWETGEIVYLSQDENIKLYAIGDQLETIKFKRKAIADDYFLFQAKVSDDLVMYFWDFALSQDATPESPDYFRQIVNHATSVPFDLQESQIASGIKSVSKHFEDAALFALYIND
ncbi:MAG: response regulator [Bacteroidota bacterium]